MTTIHETKECEEEATILEEEVRNALKALSNGKSPGSDGIPIELLKEVDEEAIKVLTAICQQIWIKGSGQTNGRSQSMYQYQKRRFQNMVKQSDNSPDIACKPSYAESHSAQIGYIHGARNMAIKQAGFTKGRGTRDQISNLRWIMERSTEYQRPIYMCFIDYSKTFDCMH